ncbi:S8 family peptidase [Bifidobacterium leontopitheci]|uniref:Subtilisin family peptidase n=1 Tax=Bifidobacterium leontopitheci TaxID=2650774 RepID=A0A6I1GFC6_9BIFI|nr:S8 family serine peptidase [Bifidobacterium leontopitheci]KAB7790245.1 subtilisin family peptidase [Bifidobacterium leontopitheci]
MHRTWLKAVAVVASVATLMALPTATALAQPGEASQTQQSQQTSASDATTTSVGNGRFTWKAPVEKNMPTIKSEKAGDGAIVYDGAETNATLVMTPASINKYNFWSDCVTATATGFTNGENIVFTDTAPSGKKRTAVIAPAQSDGSVTTKVCGANQSTEVGPHAIVASGQMSKTTAAATLTVTDNPLETVKVTLDRASVSQDKFIDTKIKVKATGLPANTKVNFMLEGQDGTIVNFADYDHLYSDADGEFTDAIQANTVNYPAGKWSVMVGSRTGSSATTVYGFASFVVTAGAKRVENKKLAVDKTKFTLDEFVKSGLTQTETGFDPFDAFDITVTDRTGYTTSLGTARANGDGTYTNVLRGGQQATIGEYTLVATSRTTGDYATAKFIVTDADGNYPPSVTASFAPTTLSKDAFGPNGDGVTVTMKNLEANGKAVFNVYDSNLNIQRQLPDGTQGEGTFFATGTADDQGTLVYHVRLASDANDDTYAIQANAFQQIVTVGDPADAGGSGNGSTATPPASDDTVSGNLVNTSGTLSAFVQVKGVGGLEQKRMALQSLGKQRMSVKSRNAEAMKSVTSRAKNATDDANDVFAALKKLDPKASKLYTSAYSIPGIAVRADADALRTLGRQNPDVIDISPIVQRTATSASTSGSGNATGTTSTEEATKTTGATPSNYNNDSFVNALKTWQKTGETGKNAKVVIIDTGIDYTHADFGGSGSTADYQAALASDADPLTDPTLSKMLDKSKFLGGYDFAGATYNADSSATEDVYDPIPKPDANPIDGPGGGHGSHVAGTLGGYGEDANGKTFTGDYSKLTDADLKTMKIGPGSAPEVGIYMLKVFGDGGGSTDVTGEALDWVAKKVAEGTQIDIVSMSLGTAYGTQDDPDTKKVNELTEAGVLSVAAAGNDDDVTDIGGSPATAHSSLAVAATKSNGALQDAIQIDQPSDLAGNGYAGQYSIDYSYPHPTFKVSGKVVPLTDSTNLDGCVAYSDEQAAAVKGKIVFATVDDTNFRCKTGTMFDNASKAGAIGVVFGSQYDVPEAGIAGNYDIPGFQLAKSSYAKLKSALEAGTVELTFDSSLKQTVRSTVPGMADRIASFSSRGIHGSYDGTVKPDIAAPGVGIISVGSGTGNKAASMSGTSMATPLTAGVAALVASKHPDWSGTRIKQQMMSTADHDIVTDDGSQAYGIIRAGIGRVDAYAAVNGDARVYVSDDPTGVTGGFGIVQVGEKGYSKSKKFTVENDSDKDRTYKVSYLPRVKTDGVSYDLDQTTVKVAAHSSAQFSVTLNIPDASKLRHTIDTTMAKQSGGKDRSYVTDASGIIRLEPADTADDATAFPLRAAVSAAPKPISETTATVKFASAKAEQGTLTVSGHGVSQGTDSEAYQSELAAMQLGALDPQAGAKGSDGKVDDAYTGNDAAARSLAAADIRAVGVASTAPQMKDPSQGMLAFGIVTENSWSRLGMTITPEVYIDASGDGRPDFEIAAGVSGDNVYAVTYDLATGGTLDVEPIDDASVSDSNTVVLRTKLSALGYTPTTKVTKITYQAAMSSVYAQRNSEDSNSTKTFVVDTAKSATYDVYQPALWFGEADAKTEGNGDVLAKDQDGVTLTAHRTVAGAATAAQPLVLHLRGAAPDAAGTSASIDTPAVDDGTQPKPTVDKTKLQSLVDSASGLKASDYTRESWAALQGALASARGVLADKDATQLSVDGAYRALKTALDGLKPYVPGSGAGNGSGSGAGAAGAGAADGAAAGPTPNAIGKTGASVAAVAIAAVVMLMAGAGVLRRRALASESKRGAAGSGPRHA